jgi:hypothetical protein
MNKNAASNEMLPPAGVKNVLSEQAKAVIFKPSQNE